MSEAPALIEAKRELARLMEEQKKRAERNKLARYIAYPKQEEFHEAGARYRERLLMAANRFGKALERSEPVLTPTGWRAIGDLCVGDEVIAGDGAITRVVGVYPQGVVPLYRLTFDSGVSIRACADHRWRVTLPQRRFKARRSHGRVEPNPYHGEQAIVTTRDIVERYGRAHARNPHGRLLVPNMGIAQMRARDVPVDPYVLGVLLGDGSLCNTLVRFTTKDTEIADAVRDGLRGFKAQPIHRGGYDWNISVAVEDRAIDPSTGRYVAANDVKSALEALGVYEKRAHEKAVPELYLYNSPDVRLALLQGLMDTDGSVCAGTGAVEFSTTSPDLAAAVEFLAQSFGGKVRTVTRTTSYRGASGEKKLGRLSYRLSIRCPGVPLFRLARKAERLRSPARTPMHILYSIEADGEGDAVCIEVDHPSHLYVTRGGVVTHNSECGAAEAAMHLTGRYPDWWKGKTFTKPVRMWAAGVTNETTRDIVQAKLFGPPGMKELWGTGFIPGECIGDVSPARGIADAIDTAMVKHESGGWSQLQFKSYERGREKWQGAALEVIWLDEESPEDIYFEALTRTNETGGIVYLTFTPLLGWSSVVTRFLGDGSEDSRRSHANRAVIMASIEDALHFTPEKRKEIIDSYPAHEREARIKGLPSVGRGRVFPIEEERITIDPIPIPRHWVHIIGIDFGWDHPFGAAHIVYDRDADVIYVTKVYRQREETPIMHAAAIRSWPEGEWAPIAWPHDGLQHDKGSGEALMTQYAAQRLNMIGEKATFPDGTNGVEAGVLEMFDRMRSGRWKVFSTCREWFEEFRLYHRAPNASGKNVQIVKERDDVLSASRYAMMMLRFADVEPLPYDEGYYNEKRRSANSTTGY